MKISLKQLKSIIKEEISYKDVGDEPEVLDMISSLINVVVDQPQFRILAKPDPRGPNPKIAKFRQKLYNDIAQLIDDSINQNFNGPYSK